VKKPPKKQIIFAIILVVVIGVSATTAVLLSQYLATINQLNQPEIKKTVSVPKKLPVEEKADTADKLAFEGNLGAGVQALDTEIANTSDPHAKFISYSRKATLLLNNHDAVGALAAAIKAYELEKTSSITAFVGQIAREKGDMLLAIEYYKKAIPLIDPEDPFADEDNAYYQGIITELERGQPHG